MTSTLTVVFGAAQLTDQWIFHHFTYSGIYEHGWGRMLRDVGYLPVWALVALALVLHDWEPRVRRTLRQASRARRPGVERVTYLGGVVPDDHCDRLSPAVHNRPYVQTNRLVPQI